MGANAISRPRTQPDPLRMFAQVKGSPFELSPTATDTSNGPHCPACVSMPGFITALINWPTGLEDERTLVETSLF